MSENGVNDVFMNPCSNGHCDQCHAADELTCCRCGGYLDERTQPAWFMHWTGAFIVASMAVAVVYVLGSILRAVFA